MNLTLDVVATVRPDFDWTPILAIGGLTISLATAVATILVALVNKKVRSPADNHAEVQFGVALLREQISKAERDSERWFEMEKYLRDELRKTDSDVERLQSLLETAHSQISSLRAEKHVLENRLLTLADKVSRGEPITIGDITGSYLDEDTEVI
jgi:hypothetical protein